MKIIRTKTYSTTSASITREHYRIDATNLVLGRLSSTLAKYLMGKHKAMFTKHIDCGDEVTVYNASKIRFTGNKLDQKMYYSYSGYPGGLKEKSLSELIEKDPEAVLRKSVSGMLPRNKLHKERLNRLHIIMDELSSDRQKELKELSIKSNE
jgi:large subunit ribosomal protein L13